ncbi:hypothetical protein F7725_006221 [Dissostichus mawsoni]|uniref:Uncharacterized protein n=1 Tax=Dissostichus mawsoni TaxID=36200 RepID=A0A7J5YTP3_DISMA|nr:hypothetical protein F7725_006221 [Dissostichus mawsoni]
MPGVGALTRASSLELDNARPLLIGPALALIQSSPPSSPDIPLPSAQASLPDYITKGVVGPPGRVLDPGLWTDDSSLDFVPIPLDSLNMDTEAVPSSPPPPPCLHSVDKALIVPLLRSVGTSPRVQQDIKPLYSSVLRLGPFPGTGPHLQGGAVLGRGYVPRLLPRHRGFVGHKTPVSRSSPPLRFWAVLRRPGDIKDSRVSGDHPDIGGFLPPIISSLPDSPFVHRHEHRGNKARNWSLSPSREVLILGASNISRLPLIHDLRVQVDSFRGPIWPRRPPSSGQNDYFTRGAEGGVIENIRILNQLIFHTHQSLPKLRRSAFATDRITSTGLRTRLSLRLVTPSSTLHDRRQFSGLSSTFRPSPSVLHLLRKGLSFIPSPTTCVLERGTLKEDLLEDPVNTDV